jgi:hypothetical protein
VLRLHECVADSIAAEFVVDPAAEPLHSVDDLAAAALTETSCLCVQV